jgi:hypothetical protein
VEIDSSHDGERGRVSVSLTANDDPPEVGKSRDARGFPMCTATVDYPGRGYRALFGWVQLVRSTDNSFDGQAFESAVAAATLGERPVPHVGRLQSPL